MLCCVILQCRAILYYTSLAYSLRGCAPVHTVWPGGAVLTFLCAMLAGGDGSVSELSRIATVAAFCLASLNRLVLS